MDPITAVSLVGTIVQLVDFSSKVVSKSTELYRSGQGVLVEDAQIEIATADLSKLNTQLKHSTATDDPDMQALCEACNEVADTLLAMLSKVKVNSSGQRWQSLRKALRSIWSKEEIQALERRLATFRAELNLRITIKMREQVSQMKEQQADQFKTLDAAEKRVADAIIEQKDVFTAYLVQLHQNMQDLVEREHDKTRRTIVAASEKIIQDDRVNKIIHWLSAPDPSSNYEKAKKQKQVGTGSWLLQGEQYAKFKDGATQFMWLHGIPGCGKSVLSSTILTDLFHSCQSHEIVVYFYFDFSDPQKQAPESMVKSIIAQLLRMCSTPPKHIDALFSSCADGQRQASIDAYLKSLGEIIRGFPHVYLVLDALDECGKREELGDVISSMAGWGIPSLHILATSRKERDIERSLEDLIEEQNIIGLQSEVVDKDIQLYIRERLSRDKSLQKWYNNDDLRVEIENVLMNGSRGMFRWAACQLDTLAKCRNRAMLRKSLATLPSTLDKTYERILSSIGEEDTEYAIRILRWLAFSARPLLLEEVAEAAAIDPRRQTAFDRDEVLEDPSDVLDICSSLVTLTTISPHEITRNYDKGSQNCQALILAHYSVQEYLTSERCLQGRWQNLARHQRHATALSRVAV